MPRRPQQVATSAPPRPQKAATSGPPRPQLAATPAPPRPMQAANPAPPRPQLGATSVPPRPQPEATQLWLTGQLPVAALQRASTEEPTWATETDRTIQADRVAAEAEDEAVGAAGRRPPQKLDKKVTGLEITVFFWNSSRKSLNNKNWRVNFTLKQKTQEKNVRITSNDPEEL